MSALRKFSTRQTDQRQAVPGRSDQVQNQAGGYVFEVDPKQRLRRFLILGTDRGTYYQSEDALTRENAEFIITMLEADQISGQGDVAEWVVDEVVAVSTDGRAPSNDPALFVLALCTSFGSDEGKRYAMAKLPEVARIGTHLFHFVQYMTQFRGWGSVAREGVAGWYGAKPDRGLALDITKYKQRDGWSHRDLLRLAHPKPRDDNQERLFVYATEGKVKVPTEILVDADVETLAYLTAIEDVKHQDDAKGVEALIQEYNLPREVIPTEYLNEPAVWDALLRAGNGMPMTAMLRNLAKMTQVGLVTPMSAAEALVVERLTSAEALQGARIHPVQVLNALLIYKQGRGMRGSLIWTPSRAVIDALDTAFYLSFGGVEPMGQRVMLALDTSSSMLTPTSMSEWLDCRTAAAAMALVTANVESRFMFTGFTAGGEHVLESLNPRSAWRINQTAISELMISPRQRLDDVINLMERVGFGGTDCALPMLYAREKDLEIDTFVIYTDNETWAGSYHPFQALQDYRKASGIDSKLAVVSMTATPFSIADPRDPGMLDVVGFDTAVPNVIGMFARGVI